jgi:hypothetical protein
MEPDATHCPLSQTYLVPEHEGELPGTQIYPPEETTRPFQVHVAGAVPGAAGPKVVEIFWEGGCGVRVRTKAWRMSM